jgi:murein DD-endopeptidase MepM/ murein hydrolase activator NlpD
LRPTSARSDRSRTRPVVWVVTLATLAFGVVGVSPATARPDINHKVAAASDDLAAASKAVSRAAAALDLARVQLPAAQQALAAANARLATAQQAATTATRAQAAATAAATAAQQRLEDAQARIAEMNRQIGALVRAVYTQGPYTELAAILSASTPAEFADRLEAVRAVSRSQNHTLTELQVAKSDLALASLQADQSRAQAAAAQQAAAAALAAATASATRARAAKARVAAIIASRAAALAVAARERAAVKKQYDALRAEQRRLAALDRGPGGFTGVPSGNLIWPVPGAGIVGGVGWRVHPVYGYKSCHTGVDIHAGYGTPIHAAANGRVIAVINGGAYGLHTLISHGGGITTMYAHQSRTAVRVGQIVRQGQVIGYAGATGWATGPHLHWEVHVNGVPYDPLGWFGSARVPVPCWSA